MEVIILCGGFGTRIQSISNGIPKALMKLGDSVFLDIILEKVFQYEVSHVYLSLYYKPDLFQEYINNFSYKKKVTYIVEPEPLGTGGAINYVLENSTITSPFFVMNGDSLSDIDLNLMAKEFEKNRYKAMIGISEVKDAERYGTVTVQNRNVVSFKEKGISESGLINNGYYIFKKEAFDGCKGSFALENILFPKLANNRELGAFKVENDNFIDMGVPDDYEKLKRRILKS